MSHRRWSSRAESSKPHSNPPEVGAFPYLLTTHAYFMTLYTTITKLNILTHKVHTFKINAAVHTWEKKKKKLF